MRNESPATLIFAILTLTACSGAGGTGSGPPAAFAIHTIAGNPANPTPKPTATIRADPSALSFPGIGPGYARNVAISQPRYTGTFSATGNCSAASYALGATSGGRASLKVTPARAGTCSIVVSSTDDEVKIPVTVTVTTIQGS